MTKDTLEAVIAEMREELRANNGLYWLRKCILDWADRLASLAGEGEQEPRVAIHCWCGKSNLDLPLSNWCGETRDWGRDGAGRQVDYECVVCKRKVSVNLANPIAASPTKDESREEGK